MLAVLLRLFGRTDRRLTAMWFRSTRWRCGCARCSCPATGCGATVLRLDLCLLFGAAVGLDLQQLALDLFLVVNLAPGFGDLRRGDRDLSRLDVLAVAAIAPECLAFLLLHDRSFRDAPVPLRANMLAGDAFLVFRPGDIEEELFAGAPGDGARIATGVEDMRRAGIQNALGIFMRAEAGVALCADNEVAAEAARLLKEDAGFFAHAQCVKLIDDEECFDAGTAPLGKIVNEVHHKESAQTWRLVMQGEAANTQIHGIGIGVVERTVKLTANGGEKDLIAHLDLLKQILVEREHALELLRIVLVDGLESIIAQVG